MARELGLDVVREPHFPTRVPGAEGRRPDPLLKDWEGGRDLSLMSSGHPPLRVLMWRGLPWLGRWLRQLHGNFPGYPEGSTTVGCAEGVCV
jgi:hypothetical protein